MKAGPLRSVALITAAALGTSACSQLTPAENAGVFGTLSGVAAGGIARAAGMSTAESMATGAAVGAIVGVTTYIIAKHQATERQRRIAEQRARAAYARMLAEQREEEAREAREARTSRPDRETQGSKPRKTADRKPTPKKPKKKIPRYIAVDTEKNEKTSPRAKKAVMIFDTQSQEMVGNNVYDVESTPPQGSTARFETYSAQYVGSGS